MLIKTIASGTGNSQALDPNPKLILWGISMAETAGSASTAEIVLRRGTKTTDQEIVAPINFAADGFGYPTFFPNPITCYEGIFLHRVSGETTVVIYYDYQ
jgi:hypothetical protein